MPFVVAWDEKNGLTPGEHCELNIPDLPDLVVCETGTGSAVFDLSAQSRLIIDSLTDGEAREPTVFINGQTSGLLRVTGLESTAQSEFVCESFNSSVTDIAVDPDGNVFAVSNNDYLYRVNTNNCQLSVVGSLAPLGAANSLSFDPAGNLYAGGGGSSTVYRAEAGTFNNFRPWHDFNGGSPAGDFVTLGNKLYVAWSPTFTAQCNLFEVTVDEDFNYLSHVDLGRIKDFTYGLASEFGKLYGIRFDELYEISVPGLELRPVLGHPRNNPGVGDADAWWGGAGLHEATFEITYHSSEQEAFSGTNAIVGARYENESNPQTLYVRVFDHLTGCLEVGKFQLQVQQPPVITAPPSLSVCTEDDFGSDFDLSVLDTAMVTDTSDKLVSYHRSEAGAHANTDLFTGPIATSDALQQIFVRVEQATTSCVNVQNFGLMFQQKPRLSIFGANSVCPGVAGVEYRANANLPVTDHVWDVSGGTIVENTGSVIVVDWGNTNRDARISLSARYEAGCDPECLIFPVVINEQLEPAAPQGPASVCASDRLGVRYEVPPVPGSQYLWTVENGSIVGERDRNSVVVNWNEDTVGKLYFEEFNPDIAQCAGVSDTLRVTIHPQIQVVPEVTMPLCTGDDNGSIELSLSQTVSDDLITWSNGSQGRIVTGLSSGDYTYTIRDNNGCITVGQVNVADHLPLAFSEVLATDVTCSGAQNGRIEAAATGGFGSYTYLLAGNHLSEPNTNGVFSGLDAGDYLLIVIDENDCRREEAVSIFEPEPLRPDLDNIINEPICPGSADGEVTVMPLGGVAPYTYAWEVDPGLNSNTISGLRQGTYALTITDANDCATQLTVTVNEFVPKIYLPDAFTPNGDGRNDSFTIVSGCTPETFLLKIYNRWGGLIFVSEDIDEAWDGTFEGQEAPTDSYAYFISYTTMLNGSAFTESLRGEFRLLR